MCANLPGPEEIARARRALCASDPALAEVDARIAPFAWHTRLSGFAGLVRAVVGQQVSVASADAVWGRLEGELGGPATPAALAALPDEAYRRAGFSGQKIRYARGLAEAAGAGRLDFARLRAAPYEDALAELVALKGVGTWTAEVFLLMAEGRMDAFPAGDIAVQEAIRWLDAAAARPSTQAAYARAESWRPHRGVAAHLLWEWYLAVKAGAMAHPLGEAGAARTGSRGGVG